MKNLYARIGGIICLMFLFSSVYAQNDTTGKFTSDVSCDLVSSYLWRGAPADEMPNLQPTVKFGYGNLEFGFWGSSNFDGSYREFDYYIAYGYKNFTLTLNDYVWSPEIEKLSYFDYDHKTTGHFLEGSLEWEGPEKCPVKLQLATFFYGADKKYSKTTGEAENAYSTYLEASYPFKVKGNDATVFMGGTFGEGFYGPYEGVVNMGLTLEKEVKISNTFGFPLKGSIIINPQAEKAWFVLGISL